MSSKEIAYWEWLFGRGEFPYFKDAITVPYPIGYTPIEVTYVPSEEKVTVNRKLMGPDGHLYNYDFDTEEAYGE